MARGPDAYADDAREALKATLARQGELTWQLARLEAEWLEQDEASRGRTATASDGTAAGEAGPQDRSRRGSGAAVLAGQASA